MENKKWNKELLDSLYQLLNYYSLTELSKMLNLHRTYISTLLYRHGYKNLGALRYRRFIDLSISDKAYIAGIIDGEGHIEPKFQRIQVSNTDKNMLNWLKKKLGGTICKKKGNGKKHKPAWIWTLTTNSTRGLLLAIMPYLIVKKKDAQNLIKEWIRRKCPNHNAELP